MPPRKPAEPSSAKTPRKRAPAKAKAPTGRKDTGKGHASKARAAAKAEAGHEPTAPASTRKPGVKLNAAQQSLRDALMIQRLAQDWPWDAIAEEAGLTERAARNAVKKRQTSAPLALRMDPVRTIERVGRGLSLSIGDFEAISARAAIEGDYSAATTAKKAANDAREKLVGLLQATGRMPQDLSTLRHLMDVREVGTAMVEAMEDFRREVEAAAALRPVQRKVAIDVATEKAIRHFESAMGFDRDAELEEGDEWVDDEEEVTATPA